MGNTTTFAYSAGLLSSVTDPLGATSYIESDSAGRRLETFDALGNSTAFSYDPLDRLTGIIDARGRLVVPAHGVNYTIVNGEILYDNQRHSGALPGQVLRS